MELRGNFYGSAYTKGYNVVDPTVASFRIILKQYESTTDDKYVGRSNSTRVDRETSGESLLAIKRQGPSRSGEVGMEKGSCRVTPDLSYH